LEATQLNGMPIIWKSIFQLLSERKGSVDNIKEANIFFTGENEWKQFSQWPPKGSTDKALYLLSKSQLNWEKSTTGNINYSEYISDPSKTCALQ